MSDSAQSAYWLSSDAENEDAPTVTNSQMTTTDTNHKNTRNDACTLESPLTATNDTNHHESASLAEVSSKPNTKTAGKKRSQHEINLAPSTVVKKKRRLNNHSNNGNTSTSTQTQRKQRTNSSNYRHCVSKFKSSMLHDIQSIIAAKLHRNHVRKRVRCLCCDKQCVLRSKARIKAYKTCDYWYCDACHVPMDDMTRIVRQMSECIDLEHEWIVQVHWKNENEWKSAKIMSSSENEITIVYFENEMEDTINLDDDDTTLRLISNGMRCKIHDTMNSDYEEVKRRSMCYEKEDEPLLEYLVKYRTKSYLHCKWLKYSDFVGKVDEYQDADGDIEMHQDKKKMMTDLVRVVRKWRKDTRPFTYYNENAYYDASFVQIDRIINDKTVRIKKKKQRNASSKQSKKYLIKWRGLSYEQCTWELLEDLNAFNAEDTRRSVMKYNHLQKLLMERATKHKRDKNSNATTRPSKPAAIDGHLSNLVHLGHGLALKDYQKEGVDWMCYNWHESRSVLLCDEMGLGKTCQTICFLSYLHSIHYIDGPFLVIAPLSTLIHWKREIERFSTMYAVIYQGNKESRAMIFANEFYFDGIYKFNVMMEQR